MVDDAGLSDAIHDAKLTQHAHTRTRKRRQDLLSKIDEVGCAAVRLELAREDEDPRHMAPDRRKVNKCHTSDGCHDCCDRSLGPYLLQQTHALQVVVFRQEVPLRREELAREVAAYEGELTQHKKQLRYLKHIAEEQGSKGAAANHHNHHGGPPSPHPAAAASSSGAAAAAGGDGGGGVEEDCPVCLESVGGRPVMVVPCGHHICEVFTSFTCLVLRTLVCV